MAEICVGRRVAGLKLDYCILFEGFSLYNFTYENHDSELTEALENGPGSHERTKHHELGRHNILLPHFEEVTFAEDSHLRFNLRIEPSFETIKYFALILQKIEDVTSAKLGTCSWKK